MNPTGAVEFIEKVFRDQRNQRVRRLQGKDFFRGDSAYCHQDVIKKCMELGIQFTITAHKSTTQWDRTFAKQGLDWQPWEYSKKEIEMAAKSGQSLPKAEIARFYWEPSWSKETLKLPIIVKRTWMTYSQLKDKAKKHGQKNFFELDTVKEGTSTMYNGSRTILLRVNESTKEVLKKIEGWRFPGFDAARIFSTS